MLKTKKICVVVPAFNEEKLISKVLVDISGFVDSIIVVNDSSKDKTADIVSEHKKRDKRIKLINHEKNKGVGSAIGTGYKFSLKEGNDITAVLAGDGQMDSRELEPILTLVLEEKADYVK